MSRRRSIAIGLTFCTALLAVVSLLTTGAGAYPEPAIVNPSWSFELEVKKPDAVSVEGERGSVQWYWYLPYKVTNKTEKDRLFIPEIVIVDDNGRIVNAGENVPTSAYPKVKKRLKNDLLLSPVKVVGKLLTGEDYAKESVAIWPASEKDVDRFTVLIEGVHGETQTITNPQTGEEQLLRRTVMLRYATPGSPDSPQDQPVKLLERKEVMR